jgi:hypothetical protein
MPALVPTPDQIIGGRDVTPAMRQWMDVQLTNAVEFDNDITTLETDVAAIEAEIANIATPLYTNALVNGAFDVWQRGTSFSSGAGVVTTVDRWQIIRGGGVANGEVTQGTPPTGFRYCARVGRTAGDASTQVIFFSQCLETADSIPMAGKTVALSFQARAGANYSGGDMVVGIATGTGTDQNVFSGYTGRADPLTGAATLTTSYQTFTYTATIPSTATELCVYFDYTPSGVAGAADYVEIAAVQLEIGSEATSFAYEPFQTTLDRCARYFQKSFPYATTPAQNAGTTGAHVFSGRVAGAVANIVDSVQLSPRMRTTPTVTFYNPSAANAFARNFTRTTNATATSTQALGDTGFGMSVTGIAGWAVNDLCGVNWTADAEL